MGKIIAYLKGNRLEVIFIFVIVVFAAFFRLYRIPEYMTFLGDEGRDARVVRRLIVNLDPVLIGPMTSVSTEAGHMYLGPLYYYLMAPVMILSNLSPVGPAVMVAILSLFTLLLIWWMGRSWFHPLVGIIASVLYAISPTVIIHARSSWNPNIMPFFALLSIWSIYKIIQPSDLKANSYQPKAHIWFLILGVSLAFVLQSHYLGLLLFPTASIFWLLKLKVLIKNHQSTKSFLLNSGFCLLIFLLLMSPLLIFDLRHDWLNFKSIFAFFTNRETSINLKVYRGFTKIIPITT